MANLCRKIGTNIYTFMQEANLCPKDLASSLNYSINDVWNVIEGKIMIPPVEIEKIAGVLGTTANQLVTYDSSSPVPNLEFMKEFSNQDSLDKILDLMDEYVEIKEAI